MDIGWPTDICHVAHVTFDRLHGFLGLPIEFELQIPCPACSAGCCKQGRMSRCWSRTIYVGNLPGDIREREVEDLFYKVGIPIPVPLYMFLLTLKVGGSKARVTWSDPVAAETREVPDAAAHPIECKLVSRQRLVKEQAAVDKEKSRWEQQF
ncbi:hypothetical protein ZWY2020_033108 [Hordeum vulgare]|nr:hypothetical protein ZWY2020_033108 [Hordeum vulgare]